MIRFKVIKASQLLMGLVIVLLAVVLTVMLARLWLSRDAAPASTELGGTSIVQDLGAVEAVAAFAAAATFDEEEGSLFAERQENEHMDATVPQIVIEKIPAAPPAAEPELPSDQVKRVLIYHTHTHEAYEMDPDDPYVPTEPWRTRDAAHSIVRVGDELAALLRDRGIDVVHDQTDHEPPKLGTAYTRSLATLISYDDQHFDCYIDIHRDAYIDGQGDNPLVVLSNKQPAAQLMMLVGNGEGFEDKPFYTENMAFARQLTTALNQIQPGLCKDVLVKNGRYNQHIGWPAILVEVGNNKNTLVQAINAMAPLAEAIDAVLGGEVFLEQQGIAVSAGK